MKESESTKRAKGRLAHVQAQLAMCRLNLSEVQRSAQALQEEIRSLGAQQKDLAYIISGDNGEPLQEASAPERGLKKWEGESTADPTIASPLTPIQTVIPVPTPGASVCPEPGLYTCTQCGWTGDVAKKGKCPDCKEEVSATADLEIKE